MMEFRHLDYRRGSSPKELGAAALDDLLDRGSLESWRRLAAEIRDDPFGELAETVLRLIEAHRMYGTSALWRAWIEGLRGGSRPGGLSLRQLRTKRGLSQQEMGRRMGMSQSDVSKLERRRDLRVSTLRSYLAAMGGRLEAWATFDRDDDRDRFRLD